MWGQDIDFFDVAKEQVRAGRMTFDFSANFVRYWLALGPEMTSNETQDDVRSSVARRSTDGGN